MGSFQKLLGISIVSITSMLNLYAGGSLQDSNGNQEIASLQKNAVTNSDTLIAKEIRGYRKIHRIWRVSFDSLASASGTCSFQLVVKSPTGKIYSSALLSSTDLPSNVTIEMKNPRRGGYLVFAKIISATGIATISFSANTSNNKNQSVYKLNQSGFAATSSSIGNEIFIGAFSVPH